MTAEGTQHERVRLRPAARGRRASVAKDAGETDLVKYLREQLAEREIETADEAWLQRMVAGIESDPNYMIESEPNDFEPRQDRPAPS